MITVKKINKATSIYEWNKDLNSGKDEQLELTVRNATDWGMTTNQASRIILGIAKYTDSYHSASIRLFASNVEGHKSAFNAIVSPVKDSWEEGYGKYYDNPITSTDGATWRYSSLSSQTAWTDPTAADGEASSSQYVIGGTTYLTGSNSGSTTYQTTTEGVDHDSSLFDVNFDITNYYNLVTGSLMENGLVIKISNEASTSTFGSMKYFSNNTNTIYYPRLELKYDDYTWSTSQTTIGTEQATVYYKGNSGKYDKKSTVRFRPVVRETFPTASYGTASVADTIRTFTAAKAVYSIIDEKTDEEIIRFDDTFTRVCADSSGMYFDVKMNSFEIGRIYKPVIRVVDRVTTNNYEYFDNKDYFEVV